MRKKVTKRLMNVIYLYRTAQESPQALGYRKEQIERDLNRIIESQEVFNFSATVDERFAKAVEIYESALTKGEVTKDERKSFLLGVIACMDSFHNNFDAARRNRE